MKTQNRQSKPQTIKPSAIAVLALSQLSLDELNEISAAGGGAEGTGDRRMQ